MENFARTCREVAFAALFCTLFYLVATAFAAIAVRAYAPADGAVLAVNWVIKCAGAFLFPLLFVHRSRAFFKGIAAGLLASLLAMLLFAAIGGGFRLNALYLVELLVCGALGGLGALVGVKLRKE